MDHANVNSRPKSHAPPRWIVWCAVAIVAFYLIAEHRAHLYGAWPYLLFLLCPLMHIFGHRHGGHNHDKAG